MFMSHSKQSDMLCEPWSTWSQKQTCMKTCITVLHWDKRGTAYVGAAINSSSIQDTSVTLDSASSRWNAEVSGVAYKSQLKITNRSDAAKDTLCLWELGNGYFVPLEDYSILQASTWSLSACTTIICFHKHQGAMHFPTQQAKCTSIHAYLTYILCNN